MRVQNLKAPQPAAPTPTSQPDPAPANAAPPLRVVAAAQDDGPTPESHLVERQALEIALLKARLQHLELVVETARSLMGSNHERLLRRLHEVPREIVELSAQLRRIDPAAAI